jgi:hypothetical protein
MTDIKTAAGNLSRAIFGEIRSLKRLGIVVAEAGALVVKTHVPARLWPADRVE